MPDISQASREIMWNISHPWIMYLLFFIAMAVFACGLYKRIDFWRKGKPDDERFSDWGKRIWLLLKELFLQNRVVTSRFPGIFHSFIIYSFIVLIITTGVIAIDYDMGTGFFRGHVYAFLTVAAEFAGIIILVGVVMAACRRYIFKPETLKTFPGDTWALVLIALLVVTGFLIEGLRIAVDKDKWAALSPVGYGFSFMFTGISEQTGKIIHIVFWWIHTALAMLWIATIPYTKFFHLISLPTNIFFSKLKPRGQLSRININEMIMSEDFDEESFNVGVEKTDDYTWKQRMDFDACISCGRCEEVCPAVAAGQPFSPKDLIQKTRELFKFTNCYDRHVMNNGDSTSPDQKKNSGGNGSKEIMGQAFDNEFIWFCRTCTACMEVCPAFIEHLDILMELRRNEVVMQGRLPTEGARSLKMLETQGNPFGTQGDRIDWMNNLGVRIIGPGEKCDVIYWIGCCTTFDPAKQKIAVDLSKLLKKCGIDFGIMGKDERCCGDPARVMGDERLFQEIAASQIKDIQKRNFKILLVSCPHCYNTLKHEYAQFGGNFNVVHHSEFLHEMIWSGDLLPLAGDKKKIVYHDPCYLGRYQKIYDSPREVLKAIPNAEILEMRDFREKSMCCGGGGGHYWMDLKKGEHINNIRIQQAQDVGADTIVTSCAYCLQMLDDSVKMQNLDEEMRVLDIATLVCESLQDHDQ